MSKTPTRIVVAPCEGDAEQDAHAVTHSSSTRSTGPRPALLASMSSMSFRRLASRSTLSRRTLVKAGRKAQLLVITATMAVIEVENRNVLALLSIVSVANIASGVFVIAGKGAQGWGGAAAVFVVALGGLCMVRSTARNIEAMDEYGQKFDDARREYLDGLVDDGLGPAPFTPAEPVRQLDEAATVASLVALAEDNKSRFHTEVMLVLAGDDASIQAIGPNVKGVERSREKVKQDYGGDARMLKDTLRCSVVCATMPLLCACYSRLLELDESGVVRILQVKNRFRAGAAAGGYMDVNTSVLFHGLVCEIQFNLKPFFELKDAAHVLFEVCRSLGLAGDVRRAPQEEPGAVPFGARVRVGVLRFLAGSLAALMACGYILAILIFNAHAELWNEPLWFRAVSALSAAAPYSILAFLIASDMIRALRRVELCVTLGLGIATLALLAAAAGSLGYGVTGLIVVYLLHFAAAFAFTKYYDQRSTARSRVAMLCERIAPCAAP